MTGHSNYTGDLAKTSILSNLFNTPVNKRNTSWQTNFLANAAEASFMDGEPQVIIGPDDLPYFQLIIPTPNKSFQCFVIRHMIDDFLLSNGLGIVINPNKNNPDWVFSYGDLLNYKLNNVFYSESSIDISTTNETLKKGTKYLSGQPSESVLPLYTRKILKDKLLSIGINNVKIFLMLRPESNITDIVFNLTPNKFNSKDEYEYAMNTISWYFPRHYCIASIDEKSHKNEFHDL